MLVDTQGQSGRLVIRLWRSPKNESWTQIHHLKWLSQYGFELPRVALSLSRIAAKTGFEPSARLRGKR